MKPQNRFAPLRRLTTRGFKSLRETTVDLGLVNVFVGANGSGKSNVLEALGVLGAALFRSVEPETLRYRGVRPGIAALYKTSLAGAKLPRLIVLEAATEQVVYRVGLDNPIHDSRSAWGIHSETLVSDGRKLLSRSPNGCNLTTWGDGKKRRLSLTPERTETAVRTALQQIGNEEPVRALVQLIEDFAIYAPGTDVLRGLVNDIGRTPLGLGGSGLAEAVRDLLPVLSQIDELWDLIEWTDRVDVVPAEEAQLSPAVKVGQRALRFRDRFMAAGRNTLSGFDASEGALYVLFLLCLALHPRSPRLFAVDNFDHALHPRMAAHLTRLVVEQLLADGGRQMLLTTHNPLVLDGLNLRDDRVRLFAVERAQGGEPGAAGARLRGETVVRRVELEEALLDQVDAGLSLSRLWIMGRLGGVPARL